MFRLLLMVCVLAWALLPAKAAVLTLSCDGIATDVKTKEKDQVTKLGVIVDLDNRVVTGLAITLDIINIDANLVSFGRSVAWRSISGTIDRITGALQALDNWIDSKTNRIIMSSDLDLICKPTKPLF